MRSSWASEQLRFFEPLQLNLELANLLEQPSFLGLNLLLVLSFLAPPEQLAGAIEELPLPLPHLDGMDGVISGDLLDRLEANNRLYGNSRLELRAVGAALAHWWEPHSGAIPALRC